MRIGMPAGLVFFLLSAMTQAAAPAAVASEGNLHAKPEKTVTGFAFPESVAFDPNAKVLYVSQFGGTELKPAQKDGKGKISKVSLAGKVLEANFLPASGDVLNKPKGIWVAGNRLWVTDIDSVWVFDLETRKGKKRELPGVEFANDVTVMDDALYVSDNRTDRLIRIEPADFLNSKSEAKVTVVLSAKNIHPNGLYPTADGTLLLAGYKSGREPSGIYSFDPRGKVKEVLKDAGRLDGLYQMKDGTILATDWIAGTLFSATEKGQMTALASGFKGPADFCVFPDAGGYVAVVPDLVKSELRFVRITQ